jgi:hypothetical protein
MLCLVSRYLDRKAQETHKVITRRSNLEEQWPEREDETTLLYSARSVVFGELLLCRVASEVG